MTLTYLRTARGNPYIELPVTDDEERVWMVRISAENVRRERTGIHAKVMVSVDTTKLAFDTFNIERNEERVRLANSAHKYLKSVIADRLPANELKHQLDLFCDGLWDEELAKIQLEELEGDPNPAATRLSLRPFVVREGGTLLFGAPGAGKSWTAMLWAVAIDAGLEYPWDCEQERVLFINLERSRSSMEKRLACVNKALGLPVSRKLAFLNARGKSLSDIYEAASRAIEANRIGVVVLDSISRAGAGSLNSDEVGNQVIDMLNRLVPTWVGLAHEKKAYEGGNASTFGSQMFRAGCDVEVHFESEQMDASTNGVHLKITKANDIPRASETWAYEFDRIGLCGIREASPGEFTELDIAPPKKMSLTNRVYAFVQEHPSCTQREIEAGTDGDKGDIARALSNTARYICDRSTTPMTYLVR